MASRASEGEPGERRRSWRRRDAYAAAEHAHVGVEKESCTSDRATRHGNARWGMMRWEVPRP